MNTKPLISPEHAIAATLKHIESRAFGHDGLNSLMTPVVEPLQPILPTRVFVDFIKDDFACPDLRHKSLAQQLGTIVQDVPVEISSLSREPRFGQGRLADLPWSCQ